jgi:mannose-1-phosphate guanylyltransferase
MLHALVMAGGGGTRFWPRSRHRKPKQFLAMGGERTLLQLAVDRLEGPVACERVWIITGAAHVAETAGQLPQISPERIVGEPVGRDTAACIGLGAALVRLTDPDAVMVVTPADHIIEPTAEFHRAVHAAALLVQEHPNALVTFGIPPTFPATGYGYIHRGQSLGSRQGVEVFQVQSFVEKPAFDLAQRYLQGGQHYWNGGIFVWRANAILDQLRQRKPRLHEAVVRVADAWNTPRRQEILHAEYEALEKVSIDYAVMQEAPEVLVVQTPFRWDDVGSWLALERMNPQDAHGNTILARHCGIATSRCVVVADAGHLVGTVGVQDLLIIQDGDATLVAHRGHEADIKTLVERLKQLGLGNYT